jgi:DNA sulfur modification protein DndE
MTSFTIKDIDTLRYRPTKAAEESLADIRSVLGLPDKAAAARLAMGRSLYQGGVSLGEARSDLDDAEKGTAIQGMHLFGNDTAAWATAISVSADATPQSDHDLRLLVEFHWQRGAKLLDEDFTGCDQSLTDFVASIAERVAIPASISDGVTHASKSKAPGNVVNSAVSLNALRDTDAWQLNAAGGNGLVVISGGSGRGKSQLAFDMLAQAARQGVRILFFDLKGELEVAVDDEQKRKTREQFLTATKAEYIRVIDSRLPINPFLAGTTDAEKAQIASEVANLVRCYAHQLGANQEKLIRDSYSAISKPDIESLAAGIEQQGGNGVGYAIIDKLRSFNIFSADKDAMELEEWLSTSRVIDLKGLGNDTETKSLIVAFILNAIIRKLSKQLAVVNGIQPLQMILFVDEAHLILPKEGKAGLLGSLARQGRSWGFPLWLASQDADAFITSGQHGVDFTALADCGVHLSPETLNDAKQRAILGQVMHRPISRGNGVIRLRGKTTVGEIRQFHKDNGAVPQVSKKL